MNLRTVLFLLASLFLGPGVVLAQVPVRDAWGQPLVPSGWGMPPPPTGPTSCLVLDCELLVWFSKRPVNPPLLTSSSPPNLGILGTPGTQTLAGDGGMGSNPYVGPRIFGLYQLDDTWGILAGAYYAGSGNRVLGYNPQVLAVPVIDANAGVNSAIILAMPGSQTGVATLTLFARTWGFDASGTYRLSSGDETIDLIGGCGYVQLAEALQLRASTTLLNGGVYAGTLVPSGTQYIGLDGFFTRNQFYGTHFGITGRRKYGRLSVEGSFILGLGMTHQEVTITGYSSLLSGVSLPVMTGNLFAQASNVGRYTRNVITAMPRSRTQVGYQLTERIRVFAGYDFVYWPSVVRPGNQIDRRVNLTQVPLLDTGTRTGPADPMPRVKGTDYWIQGMSLGFDVTF